MEYTINITTEEYVELKKQGIDLVQEIGKVASQLGAKPDVGVQSDDTVSKVDAVALKAQRKLKKKETTEKAIVGVWKDCAYMTELVTRLKAASIKFNRKDLEAKNADKSFLKKHSVSKLPPKQTDYDLDEGDFKTRVLGLFRVCLESVIASKDNNSVRFDFTDDVYDRGIPYLTNIVKEIVNAQSPGLDYNQMHLQNLAKSTIEDYVSEKEKDDNWPEDVRRMGIMRTTSGAIHLSVVFCELAVADLQQD
jgi:hypothetical protein